jgi:hypothetical protein
LSKQQSLHSLQSQQHQAAVIVHISLKIDEFFLFEFTSFVSLSTKLVLVAWCVMFPTGFVMYLIISTMSSVVIYSRHVYTGDLIFRQTGKLIDDIGGLLGKCCRCTEQNAQCDNRTIGLHAALPAIYGNKDYNTPPAGKGLAAAADAHLLDDHSLTDSAFPLHPSRSCRTAESKPELTQHLSGKCDRPFLSQYLLNY